MLQDRSQVNEGRTIAATINNQTVCAIVSQVGRDDVTLDFNHPFAGKTPNLEVEVTEVRRRHKLHAYNEDE